MGDLDRLFVADDISPKGHGESGSVVVRKLRPETSRLAYQVEFEYPWDGGRNPHLEERLVHLFPHFSWQPSRRPNDRLLSPPQCLFPVCASSPATRAPSSTTILGHRMKSPRVCITTASPILFVDSTRRDMT